VFLLYAMRRVDCGSCGVTVEKVPWAEGKSPLTKAHMWFLASWAKRMSWQEVAVVFQCTWQKVFLAVEKAVEWGLAQRDVSGISAIGVDEVLWHKGYKFLTVVYQIDAGSRRLLWVGQDRTLKTMLRFFRWFGKDRSTLLRFVCSDMWQPYLRVIAKKADEALHVLDRFHIMEKITPLENSPIRRTRPPTDSAEEPEKQFTFFRTKHPKVRVKITFSDGKTLVV
jgi:transposase